MFMVSLELFEHVRNFFGVGYTLHCHVRILNYNLTRSACYMWICMLRVASDDETIYVIVALWKMLTINTYPVSVPFRAVPRNSQWSREVYWTMFS